MIQIQSNLIQIYFNRSNANNRQWSIGFPDGAEIEVGEIELDKVWSTTRYDKDAVEENPKAYLIVHDAFIEFDPIKSYARISNVPS